MNAIFNWLKSKNITSHSLAVAAFAFAVAFDANSYGIRDTILQLFHNHPSIATDITLAVGVILKYMRSTKAVEQDQQAKGQSA